MDPKVEQVAAVAMPAAAAQEQAAMEMEAAVVADLVVVVAAAVPQSQDMAELAATLEEMAELDHSLAIFLGAAVVVAELLAARYLLETVHHLQLEIMFLYLTIQSQAEAVEVVEVAV